MSSVLGGLYSDTIWSAFVQFNVDSQGRDKTAKWGTKPAGPRIDRNLLVSTSSFGVCSVAQWVVHPLQKSKGTWVSKLKRATANFLLEGGGGRNSDLSCVTYFCHLTVSRRITERRACRIMSGLKAMPGGYGYWRKMAEAQSVAHCPVVDQRHELCQYWDWCSSISSSMTSTVR